jgi:hypothetical protein
MDGLSNKQSLSAIAKSLASTTTPELLDSWKILLAKWYTIIKEDGEW